MVNSFRVTWNRHVATASTIRRTSSSTHRSSASSCTPTCPGVIGARRHQRLHDLGRQLGEGAGRRTRRTRWPTTCRWCAAGTRCRSAATCRTGRPTRRDNAHADGRLHLQRHGDRPRAGRLPHRAGLARCEHGAPASLHMNQWYLGRVRPGHVESDRPRDAQRRPALGAVLRAEHHAMAPISNFVLDNFQQGHQDQRGSRTRRPGSSIPATRASRRQHGHRTRSGGTSRRARASRGT